MDRSTGEARVGGYAPPSDQGGMEKGLGDSDLFCSTCGTKRNNPNAQFCGTCGQAYATEEAHVHTPKAM